MGQSIKRGDIVTVAAKGHYSGKPRPALVLQSDLFSVLGSVTLCLLTTDRRDLAVRYMERTVQSAPESDEAKKARRFLGGETG